MTKVLVVDDDAGRDVIDLVLVAEGYQVVGTGDGAMAHDVAAQEKPVLIVLNIKKPNINGLEVLHELKTDQGTRAIPVIIVNGEDGVQDAERGIRSGAVDYVTQPWAPGRLEDRIRIALTRSGAAIPTGNELLDRAMMGGMTLGNLTLVDGGADSGKSVLCQHLAYGALLMDQTVAFYVQGMTPDDLAGRMETLGLDIAPSLEEGQLLIYSLEDFYGEDSEAESALVRLQKHMEDTSGNTNVIILDALTGLVDRAGSISSVNFITECRFLCSPQSAVIISLDAAQVDPLILSHLEDLAGSHVSLHVGEFTEGSQRKAMNVLQTIKIKGTTLRTRSTICFVVDPDLARSMDMSLKVLPDVGT
tara:strand:- start:199 stop:1281 length:1083 start_codon:yes stop_codon:yes gene_type:complete